MPKKKGKQRQGICVYCETAGPIEDEHVFARRLFLTKDEQMVTVPSCRSCNQLKELGEKDIHLYVTMHILGGQHPDALEHAKLIIAKSNVRTKQWLRKSIANATEIILTTDEGIEIGRALEMPFNHERIITSLEMMIRGLHHYETQTILPSECPVFVGEIPWTKSAQYAANLSRLVPVEPIVKGNFVAAWQSFPIEGLSEESKSWMLIFNNQVLYDGSAGELAERLRAQLDAIIAENAPHVEFENRLRQGMPRTVRVPKGPDGKWRVPSLG